MDAKRTAIHFELKKVEFHFVNEKHEEKNQLFPFHRTTLARWKRIEEIE